MKDNSKEKVVEIKDVVKRYKKNDVLALNHLDLDVYRGEVLGLLGANGSGKSTTINCLLSLLSYDEGEIKLFGEKMLPTSYTSKRKIGVVPQDVAVFEELNVQENIAYFCSLYVDDKNLCKKYVEEAIEFVGLQDFKKFSPKKLSGGLKRRLNIACGIAHKPELIILDEPTVAVDPQSRNKILENIKELNHQGSTIIYTTHYMEEVERLCDRIVIIDKGSVIALGTKEDLMELIPTKETVIVEEIELSEDLQTRMKEIKNIGDFTLNDGVLSVSFHEGRNNVISVLSFFDEHNLTYGKVSSQAPTLNDVFLDITGRELRD